MAQGTLLDDQSVPGSIGQTNPMPVKEFGGNIIKIAYHSVYTDDIEYVGMAVPGTGDDDFKWQIRKIAYAAAGKPTSVLYADGDLKFDNQWSDREGLDYS